MGMLSSMIRLWCVHEGLKLVYVCTNGPSWAGFPFAFSVAAVSLAAMRPTLSLTLLALLIRLSDTVQRVPFVWDSYYWCLQTDGALLVICAAHWLRGGKDSREARDGLALWWGETVRLQLALFYGAAALFKLNTAFLDHR